MIWLEMTKMVVAHQVEAQEIEAVQMRIQVAVAPVREQVVKVIKVLAQRVNLGEKANVVLAAAHMGIP